MRFGSVCSGIEAASVAWHPLGWSAAFMSEIDAFPRAVLAHHYPEAPLHGDFTTIWQGDYEPIDLLVGGTPCQSFSVAGLRAGFNDDRGNLALEFCRLTRRLSPRWVVWENVPGVLSLDGGRAFGSILGGLAECGYGLAYRMLDAQYVRVDGYARAVPQRRSRVFVVGYLGDWRRAAAVLFEPEGLRGDSPPRRETGAGAACGTLDGTSPGGGWRFGPDEAAAGQLIPAAVFGIGSDCLDRSGDGAGGTAAERSGLGIVEGLSPTLRAKRPNAVAFGGNNTRGPIDASTALNAHGGPMGRMDFESETFVVASAPPAVAPTLDASFGRLQGCSGQDLNHGHGHLVAHTLRTDGFDASEDGTGRGTPLVPVADTLTSHWHQSNGAKAGNNVGMINPVRQYGGVRRLTPCECERLMGFPDDYTLIPWRKGMAADGPRYKALGNSFAVNVVRWIGQRIAMVETIS